MVPAQACRLATVRPLLSHTLHPTSHRCAAHTAPASAQPGLLRQPLPMPPPAGLSSRVMIGTPTDVDRFIDRWQHASGSERANFQPFAGDLCGLLGVDRPHRPNPNTASSPTVTRRWLAACGAIARPPISSTCTSATALSWRSSSPPRTSAEMLARLPTAAKTTVAIAGTRSCVRRGSRRRVMPATCRTTTAFRPLSWSATSAIAWSCLRTSPATARPIPGFRTGAAFHHAASPARPGYSAAPAHDLDRAHGAGSGPEIGGDHAHRHRPLGQSLLLVGAERPRGRASGHVPDALPVRHVRRRRWPARQGQFQHPNAPI